MNVDFDGGVLRTYSSAPFSTDSYRNESGSFVIKQIFQTFYSILTKKEVNAILLRYLLKYKIMLFCIIFFML